MTPWERFVKVARGEHADSVPVALIVDSPWLPGYANISTVEYFVREDEWLRINLELRERFPEVAWIPGFWVEYGMAIEPSAFGGRLIWHHDQPPSIEPPRGGLEALLDIGPVDPQRHGLMPLALARYRHAEALLLPYGLGVKMVAARGPLAIGAWLLGMSEFLVTLKTEPERAGKLLDVLTTTVIDWLRAQLGVVRVPEGILLLDDMVGMLSPKMFEQFARPYLTRIFSSFEGMIRVFHNDTPCPHLLEPMSTAGFDVFNYSHTMDTGLVREKMPNVTLMGNVPPLDLMVRGTVEQVETWARECIRKTTGKRFVLSAGGGASPGTRPETVDALVRATHSA